MTFLGTIFVYVLLFGSLLYWPVFMAVRRRWDFAAKRVFAVFLINVLLIAGYWSIMLGPWKARDANEMPFYGIILSNVFLIAVSIICSFRPTSSLSRFGKWTAVGLVTIETCLAIHVRFVIDWANEPVCHKNLMFALMSNEKENSDKELPNLNGNSRDSLALINPYGPEDSYVEDHYGYVPGLTEKDPGDLVLCYMTKPTRWIFHGYPQSRFKPKGWMVVPVAFEGHSPTAIYHGECSECLTTTEFRARLQKTLDFLRANNRPHWQTVVAEQTRFLDSIRNL